MNGFKLARIPEFFKHEINLADERIFQPQSMPMRGELYAYGLAFSVFLATLFFRDQTGDVSLVGVFITGFFLIIGLILTFGAWMERGTRITVSAQMLVYKNPLRRINLPWDKVVRIHALWLRERWKMAVFSEDGRIIFSTEFPDDEPGLLSPGSGFINGPMLAALIRSYARLSEPTWQENAWTCEKNGSKGG